MSEFCKTLGKEKYPNLAAAAFSSDREPEWLINTNEPNVGNDNRSENNQQNGSLNVDHPCSDQTRLIAARIEVGVPGQKRT